MENKSGISRQPYEPPEIRRIKVVPEELAAAACKKVRISNNVCRVGGKLVNKTIGS
jgi:hypothetical protein